MLKFRLDRPAGSHYRILCLGAHCDDIEIGCGGTILRLLKTYKHLSFHWVIFSKGQRRRTGTSRAQEASSSANAFLAGAKDKTIIIHNFRDGFFPYVGSPIKDYFENLKEHISPDIIFTHYRNDLHQDHRLISELTWNTFRNHLILEYEIPKYDGDLGIPNFFIELDDAICQSKLRYIFDNYKSQTHKDWFTESTLSSLLRLRGVESRASSKCAEAFYCRKVILQECT